MHSCELEYWLLQGKAPNIKYIEWKKKTLCLVSSKYGIFWRLFKTFTFPQRKWQKMMHQLNTQKIAFHFCLQTSWEDHLKLNFEKMGSENTVFGTKETNPRSGWYFITLKSLSWVNFQSQISKKIHWPLTSKTSPYKKINYKTFERR